MKYSFFDLQINYISEGDILQKLIANAANNTPSYLCAVNVHMTVEAQSDKRLMEAVNNATWSITDGVPVAWAYSKLMKINQSRIAGMDLTPKLLEESDKLGLVVSVYGNTKENLNKFSTFIKSHHPNIKIGSFISPPYRDLRECELNTHLSVLNSAHSQLIFVSLGCPKQEKWMLENSHKIKGVCLGIGNAINTTIGQEKRPHKLVQTIGMEWLFRLIQNPKRLFKRYLYTNSKFCVMILKEVLNIKKAE